MTDPTPIADLQPLIDRLRAGDLTARDALLAASIERLRRLTHQMLVGFPRVHRWEETLDVLQNACIRLHRTLAEIAPETPADFFRLAALNIRRELLDLHKHYFGPQGHGAHHQSLPAEATYDPLVGLADAATPAPDGLVSWEAFHDAVEHLPVEDRETFELLWYHGLTQVEAAGVLGVADRTIKRRWQSARLRLVEALDGRLPD